MARSGQKASGRCVHLPGGRLRAARGNPLRGRHLRLPLGWEPGILNGEGGKPKWMRWRGRSVQAVALKFGLLVSDFRF